MEKTEIMMETKERRKNILKGTPKQCIQFPFLQTEGRQILEWILLWCGGFLWSREEFFSLLHPMGMTYLSAFFGSGQVFWGILSGVALGSIGNGDIWKNIGILLAAVLIEFTLGGDVPRDAVGKKAVFGAFAVLLGGLFYAVGQGGLMFYFVVAAVESAMTLGISMILQKGLAAWMNRRNTPVFSREETLAVFLLFGGSLAGAANIGIPFLQGRLFPFLAAFCLLYAAWKDGIGGGAAAGVLLGFLLYVCGRGDLPLFTVFAVGGMLAGSLRELGRLTSAVAFWITAALFLFYVEQSFLEFSWLPWMAAGCVVFALLPAKILERAGGLWEQQGTKDRYIAMREAAEEKLLGFSKAFRAMAKTFRKEEEKEKGEISSLVDVIAKRVCQNCGMAQYCWQEEVYRTYSMTFSALSYCDTKGKVRMEQMPAWFLELCPRGAAYVSTIGEVYGEYRHDLLWTERLRECRELVGQQLAVVGDILAGLADSVEPEGILLSGKAEELEFACKKAGVSLCRVTVTADKNNKGKKVVLYVKDCHEKGVCRDRILPIIRKVMDCAMQQAEGNVCHITEDGFCRLTFVEEPLYHMTTATANLAAKVGEPCGDSASFMESERGVAWMAVSDGMGMGERASKESRTAIELLEQFGEAGFPKETAVRLINSVLLLRHAEENYATLDLCSVDLYSGQAEFVKLGAAASYICRGNRVISVYTHSLPAGILERIPVEKNDMLLKDGDLILLFTDGITDAFGGESQTAAWMQEHFLPHGFANPQDAADFILQAAKEMPKTAVDDMTVLAARFWRKVI